MGTGIFPQYISSRQLNAPQMGSQVGAEGQILRVLDACLVNGFGDTTVASARIEGEFVVLNFGSKHDFLRFQFVLISGATSSNLNGKKKILKMTATEIYLEKGGVTDVSGSLSVKVAPLGWQHIGGTADPLLRAYKSKLNPTLNKILHLDCNLPTRSKYGANNPIKKAIVSIVDELPTMGGFKSLTNDYLGNYNYTDGYFHWVQAVESDYPHYDMSYKNNTDWVLIGDEEFFYFCILTETSYNQTILLSKSTTTPMRRTGYAFGRLPTTDSLSKDSTFLSARRLDVYNRNTAYISGFSDLSNILSGNNQGYVDRAGFLIKSYSGLELYKEAGTISNNFASTGTTYSGWQGGLSYLRPLGAALALSSLYVKEYNNGNSAVGGWKLPYIKTINTDIFFLSSRNTEDQRIFDDGTILIGLSVGSSSYTIYVAFSLLEEREIDLLS